MIKWGMDLLRKRSLLDLVQHAPTLEENYKNDFVLLSTESLIKAVESRLDRNPKSVDDAARLGYVLAPFFADQLPLYEKQPQGMRFYLPEMIKAIDLDRESKRIAAIKFDTASPARMAKHSAVAQAPAPEVSAAGKMLEQAEDLYARRSLEEARQLYVKALQQRGSSEEHAQAWYGLARIAVLQNDPESAVKLFEKTLGASPDAQTKAWTFVYLARLSKAAKDFDSAGRFYQEALAVNGASERARQAAQSESANIPRN